jgi:glycosyltransferase involved in cell wall biosynthesis
LNILVLSFYYSPDLCAGSFRTTALVDQLLKTPDIHVDIVTTMPNRYASFEKTASEFEEQANFRIRRIRLPSHKSGMFDQIRSFLVFYKQTKKLVKNEDYALVFATSSRLFTAFLGASIAKEKSIPLYLDVRDIFVDTIKDVLNPKIIFFLKPLLRFIEYYTFSNAKHINLVSKGFERYFVSSFKKPHYSFFTNGIDDEFLNLSHGSQYSQIPKKINIVYGGNVGEGQGLEHIIPGFAKAIGQEYQITIIGDGGRKKRLEKKVSGINNVKLLPPVERKFLCQYYLDADILFLHLNDYPAFEKVLPSKIFEYAATGKPILAGVSGYAAQFIKKEVKNAYVFYPNDVEAAVAALKQIAPKYTDRSLFIETYARKNIMSKMAASIINMEKV